MLSPQKEEELISCVRRGSRWWNPAYDEGDPCKAFLS